jgi:hypothetical protein
MWMGRNAEAVTRTFRINRASLDVLEAEANKESLSASALLNKILQRYVDTTYWGGKYDFINFPNSIFVKILKNMSEEEAYNLGEESARGDNECLINFLWRDKTIDEFLDFVSRNYGTYSGWFRLTHQNNDNRHMVVTQHSLDSKWSHFLAGYIKTLFKVVQGMKLETSIGDNSVAFTFETESVVLSSAK